MLYFRVYMKFSHIFYILRPLLAEFGCEISTKLIVWWLIFLKIDPRENLLVYCGAYFNSHTYFPHLCAVLQIGRSLVRSQMVSLEFFH